MINHRLELALERLRASDWERFERLASVFLASEFDDLRTVASPSGDEGRDAELFCPVGDPKVVIQYSVTPDWRKKIAATVKRLKATMPKALELIYVSNQVIGAQADDLKKLLRRSDGLSLDIRDRSWFVERVFMSVTRQAAAEELAVVMVDPYLSSAGVGPYVQAELSSPEAIAAVTFLGLQWQDEIREKGLTKIAFEALVRATLISTDSQRRLSRAAIHAGVAALLPGHPASQIAALVDGAIRRLLKHAAKHWAKDDEFCLAHEEVQRVNEFRVNAALAESRLMQALERITCQQTAALSLSEPQRKAFCECLRAAADAVLFERSQAFAMAVHSGTLAKLADTDFGSSLVPVQKRGFPGHAVALKTRQE